MGVGEKLSPVSTLGTCWRVFEIDGREGLIFSVEDTGKARAAAVRNRYQTSGVSSDGYNLHLFQLLLDWLAAFLAGSTIVALTYAAADSLFLFGRVGCRLGFPRRRESSAAGGGFGTLARVDFGFQSCGFFFNDAESAFNGVIGCTCRLLVKVVEESEMYGVGCDI